MPRAPFDDGGSEDVDVTPPQARFEWSVLRATPGKGRGQRQRRGAPTQESAPPPRDGPPPRAGIAQGVWNFPVRVNDLKQFAYCPRIVFYQYTMPVQRKATFKMEHGKAVEPRVEHLEHRRKLRAYALADGKRQFQVWLRSERLNLVGRLDMMITTPQGIYPVDFKDTFDRIHHNHRVQLCAYALLIEDAFRQAVPTGFIYRVPRNDVMPVDITPDLRVETRRCLNEIREMIRTEKTPPPTPVRARCTDCEYRNYCGDIF